MKRPPLRLGEAQAGLLSYAVQGFRYMPAEPTAFHPRPRSTRHPEPV